MSSAAGCGGLGGVARHCGGRYADQGRDGAGRCCCLNSHHAGGSLGGRETRWTSVVGWYDGASHVERGVGLPSNGLAVLDKRVQVTRVHCQGRARGRCQSPLAAYSHLCGSVSLRWRHGTG